MLEQYIGYIFIFIIGCLALSIVLSIINTFIKKIIVDYFDTKYVFLCVKNNYKNSKEKIDGEYYD